MKNSKHSVQSGGEKPKPLNKIPYFILNTENIMKTADGIRELVAFDSNLKGYGYVTDGEDALIVTRQGGYLRIHKDLLNEFIEELEYLSEEIERRNRD